MDNEIVIEEKKDKGFTLIELLIVIVILGILATVVVFAVAGITDRGQTNACKAELKTVEVAIEAYYAQTGSYPATAGGLTGTGDNAFLRAAPTYWTVTNGTIGKTAAGTADCTEVTVF